jgi:uncharacterized protein YjgD (DUF1641 family)
VVKPVDTSYAALLKQLHDPSVRRGLGLTLRVLQVVGNQAVRAENNHNNSRHPKASLPE